MALEYVIITPARNEVTYLELTIQSVVAQTILPKRWVIVSDGSTDGTDAIVEKYSREHPWLQLVSLPPRKERNFAGKANAFNAGYERVKALEFDVVGNIDGDVSFVADYFEYLLARFQEDPKLGVAGTPYVEGDFHSFKDSYMNVHHVNGSCQLFRRACFEEIGGYVPIKGGGIDWVAVTTARMKGWKTYSFAEREFRHHRKIGTAGTGTAGTGEIGSRFHYGKKDYFLGGHPLWELFRGTFQMAKKPYVVGGLAMLAGYLSYWIRGVKRPVSDELVRFYRREQMTRLKQLVLRRFGSVRQEDLDVR